MRIITLLTFLPLVAFADDDCKGNCPGGTTVDTDVSADVANNIAGDSSKALALGNSLGDVDISQCLGSTQWSSPVYGRQKLVLNNVCMAEFYLNQGKWKLAAMALCNQPEILKEFTTEEECELAHNFEPQPVPVIVPIPGPSLVEQEEEIESLEERIARIERDKAIAARKAKEKRAFVQQTISKLEQVTDNDREE
jgi:hypothetical protein